MHAYEYMYSSVTSATMYARFLWTDDVDVLVFGTAVSTVYARFL